MTIKAKTAAKLNYNIVDLVHAFMTAGDQSTNLVNIRQSGFYVGMQLEELNEKLAQILGEDARIVLDIEKHATAFKQGFFDHLITEDKFEQMLDGDVDLAWVSLAAAYSQGANVQGAVAEVGRSNMSKADPETGKMNKDANGKVIKPATFSTADLKPFIGR